MSGPLLFSLMETSVARDADMNENRRSDARHLREDGPEDFVAI